MAFVDPAEQLHRNGASHVAATLDGRQLATLLSSIRPETAAGAVRGRSQSAYGARGLLVARPHLRLLFTELMLGPIAEHALGAGAFPIDAIFFDKRSDANWAVPAHQDVVVPVPFSADLTGVRNVRHRHGLSYGEPADHVLQELVALRVHFDDAGPENGGLSIVHGSHSLGRLSSAEILRIPSESYTSYDCRAGDVLLMKPLAVHRSGRAVLPRHRRVLQVLYGPRDGWHARGAEDAA
jgi:ectoine hydroxylase-related dioxygenase (phytanoyl-CoA dioxygenase family)